MGTSVAVISPHTTRNGNTITSSLIALGLTETKRKIFLTHASHKSLAFQTYFGVEKQQEDRTTTATQLVKLMREGAVQPIDVQDYCTTAQGYLDIFTSIDDLFGEDEMRTLLGFVMNSDAYEIGVYDVDVPLEHPMFGFILQRSDIVVLNVSPDFLELKLLKDMIPLLSKLLKGKTLFLVCNKYDSVAIKEASKITEFLGLKTSVYLIRDNPWVKWSCNNKKILHMFNQAKIKDGAVNDIFTYSTSLASRIFKASNKIIKERRGG